MENNKFISGSFEKKKNNQTAPNGPVISTQSLGSDLLRLFPAILFSAIVILLVRTQTYHMPMSQFFWTELTDETLLSDSFTLFKMKTIVFCAVLALIWLFCMRFLGDFRFKKDKYYIFIGIYALFTLLSYVASPYKEFAWKGAQDRFEGTLTILCYFVLFIFIANVIKTERDLKIVLWPIGISMFILGLLGISQALGHDFFRTLFGQKIITPIIKYADGTNSWDIIDNLFKEGKSAYDFSFYETQVYQTVFNPNYVPLYICLVLPLFAFLFIRCFDKKETSKLKIVVGILSLILFGLSLYCFLGSDSVSGFFGLAALGLAAIIVFFKKIKEWILPLIALVLVAAVVFVLAMSFWIDDVKNFFADANLIPIAYAEELPKAEDFKNAPSSVYADVERILTGENWVSFTVGGNILVAMLDASGLSFYDSDSNPVAMYPIDDGSNYYMFLDERFHDYVKFGYSFSDDGTQLYLVFNTKGTDWTFHYTDEGFLYCTPVSTKEHPREVSIGQIPSWGFEGNYEFGTQRGYIWARTIPMLKSRILLGSGADTYGLVFPQEDYAGKYSYQHNILIITNKPHSIFLQIGVNTGCVSLAAFIGLIVYFMIDCIKHSCKMKGLKPLAEYVGSAAFLGIIGFCGVGAFNDSTVCTMPLFYSILALGFACNRMVEAEEV